MCYSYFEIVSKHKSPIGWISNKNGSLTHMLCSIISRKGSDSKHLPSNLMIFECFKSLHIKMKDIRKNVKIRKCKKKIM